MRGERLRVLLWHETVGQSGCVVPLWPKENARRAERGGKRHNGKIGKTAPPAALMDAADAVQLRKGGGRRHGSADDFRFAARAAAAA